MSGNCLSAWPLFLMVFAVWVVLFRILKLITPTFIGRYEEYKLRRARERTNKAFERQMQDASTAWKDRHTE